MIKSLHNKLARLLILAISLALLLASGAALFVSERQLTLREQAAFLGRVDALAQDVRMKRSVNNAQLAKIEAADRMVLSIYDNGLPLSFRGGWRPATARAKLMERAVVAAEGAGVSMGGGFADARYVGELRGDHGERYLVAVQTLGGYRRERSVAVLMDMRAQDGQRAVQRWLFAGITLCAAAIMSAFGWWFTGRAVRPIAQAYAGQKAFVAAASHELRTPLQIMQSSLDALKDSPRDSLRFTDAMQRELSRMGRLSEDLSMLVCGGEDADSLFGPVELAELLGEAVRDYAAAAQEKQIALKLTGPEAPPIEGDPPMLRRAVNVLIDNAVCYTQPGGCVQISIKTEYRQVLVYIEDDGPGIAPEHRPHIFERFYRADHSRRDRSHSGLGLSIAREIVQRHGGRLFFEARAPRGSRFVICLPRVPHESR